MFGLDLQRFIEENITFTNDGSRPNQDIYYNVKKNKFWTHDYCGNESLSPETERENILIYKIRNTDEFEMLCENCDGVDDKRECDCPLWQECQAQSLYDNIREHEYDDLWGGNGVYRQIEQFLEDCHYWELAEIDLLLEEIYGDYHIYLSKAYDNLIATDLCDQLVDDIVEYGFFEKPNDGWLDSHCEMLRAGYGWYDEEIKDEKLLRTLYLLGENKILEALEVLKAS